MSIKYANTLLVDGGAMTADITSDYLDIRFNYGVALQAVWSGTSPVGNLIVQGTCRDISQDPAGTSLNWTNLGGTTIAVSGNSGSILYNLEGLFFTAVRVFYDFTSGTGSLDVTANIKGV